MAGSYTAPQPLSVKVQELAAASKLRALYLPPYAGSSLKVMAGRSLRANLQGLPPHREVHLAVVEGPYEDDAGDGAYFEIGKQKLAGRKLSLDVRRDVFVAILKTLRVARTHGAEVLVADEQGAVVALATLMPPAIEAAMAARTVQGAEVLQLGQAWNKLKLVVLRRPGLGKARPGFDLFLEAVPEWKQPFPEPALRAAVIVERRDPFRQDIEKFCEEWGLPIYQELAGLGLDPIRGEGPGPAVGAQWSVLVRQEVVPLQRVRGVHSPSCSRIAGRRAAAAA